MRKLFKPTVILNESRFGGYYLVDHEGLDEFEIKKLLHMPDISRPSLDIDSCNGLVFVREPPYCVSNPITGDFITLPKSPKYDKDAVVSDFGFDPITQEYKVMRMVQIGEDYREVEVYTFSSGLWTTIADVPYTLNHEMSSNVFVNGAFHWLGYNRQKCKTSEVIFSFKLGTEEFQEIPLPSCLEVPSEECFHYLLILGDCLCLGRYFFHEPPEIWTMKNYGEKRSWTKEYVFRINSWFEPFEAIEVMKDGRVLFLCDREFLGYYNTKTDYYRFFLLEDSIPPKRFISQSLIHVGSLISPRNIGRLTKRYMNY